MLPSGKLFVEDDDPQRALSNLIKYWLWCTRRAEIKVTYLIHIIGASGESVHLKHCDFVAAKMQDDLWSLLGVRLGYRQIHIGGGPAWQQPDTWLDEIRTVLAGIVHEGFGRSCPDLQ
jgi:hypothetical protein